MRTRPITDEDLAGLPGLREQVRVGLLDRQPSTVFEALCIRGVGRATTRELLRRGVLTDPEGLQRGSFNDEQFQVWMRARERDRLGPRPSVVGTADTRKAPTTNR